MNEGKSAFIPDELWSTCMQDLSTFAAEDNVFEIQAQISPQELKRIDLLFNHFQKSLIQDSKKLKQKRKKPVKSTPETKKLKGVVKKSFTKSKINKPQKTRLSLEPSLDQKQEIQEEDLAKTTETTRDNSIFKRKKKNIKKERLSYRQKIFGDNNPNHGSRLKRLGAFIIDLAIYPFYGIAFCYFISSSFTKLNLAFKGNLIALIEIIPPTLSGILLGLFVGTAVSTFFKRQTIGQSLFKLQVECAKTGNRPSVMQSILRAYSYCTFITTLGLGSIFILSSYRRSPFDIFSGTAVVKKT